jgi:hypothetical protein
MIFALVVLIAVAVLLVLVALAAEPTYSPRHSLTAGGA